MSLIETNLFEVAKRQYFFKLKAYFEFIFSLIIFQIIGILFGLGGISSEGVNYVTITKYSSTVVMLLTVFILCGIGIVIQTEKYRKINETIVGDKWSNGLSDMTFIITLCIFGGITSALSGYIFRAIFFFTDSGKNIVSEGFYIPIEILLVSIISTILYAVLISSLGYLAGALISFHKVFIIILPAVFIGVIFLRRANEILFEASSGVYDFYCAETSLLIFAVKVIITSAIFFAAAVAVTSKLEAK